MALAYPAPGLLLPRATYDGTHYPEPVWASMRVYQKVIPNASYSMYLPLDDAETFRLVIKYASAPAATTTIEIATHPSFADAQTLDTIPLSATATASFWSSADWVQYSGFIRVNNTSTVSINSIYAQKQVSTGVSFSV